MLEVKVDAVAGALDDIADLCEHWKRNRERGRMPNAIRAALLMSMRDAVMLHNLTRREAMDGALESLADELERIGRDAVESSHLRPQINTVALGMRNLAREFS